MPRHEVVKLTLPAPVAQEAARRAERCGLPVSRWASQVVESFLASERCNHGAPRPAPDAEPAPPPTA